MCLNKVKHRVLFVLMAVLITACNNPASREILAEEVKPARAEQIAGTHNIYVATTRERSSRELEYYGGVRAPKTDFARVNISVPASHEIGQIERRKGHVADPAKYFTATSISAYSEPAFAKAVGADIARHDGHALVFVHGYKTSFDAAVYRMTQIVHDADFKGTPILFSWASGGKIVDYVYDNNSATAARDALEGTLRLVAKHAKRVDIVAHSMGNWVAMEALRQLAIAGDPTLGGKLGDVVLASPDIDVDVFKAQMRRYGKPQEPFILLLSGDDRALKLSSFLAGERPRVGDYADAADLAAYGVAVLDLTAVKGDRLGHTKFAANPVVIKLLGAGLNYTGEPLRGEEAITERINQLGRQLGGSLGTAAEIVLTTPISALRVVVGE
ncbi:MAG: alpha/beta hydrolase [Rhizobiaceae bacterium]|nr:alpha/beta hydrolase [Rhizobiaceae bacterium]